MQLKLYNTLTRSKDVLAPFDPRRVRMYVCGPTVYDFAHIGNARPVIVFDVLFRLLRHLYGAEHVTYVRNITDVDDKINARAAERGISIRELTEATYQNFKADVAALGCLPPTVEPRATEYIHRTDGQLDMITLIGRLVANGSAYAADGHVLFHVPSMQDYGGLSRRPLDEMVAGARVEVAPYKRDPTDFVLWKPSRGSEPGWESPWGYGRPGWHIECSAMAGALLGETFDIHGGGIDLVFPHHENEIAQSRCAFGTDVMAQIWMHNGFLQVEGEKMAKSAGNFVTIRELLAEYVGSAARLAMLMTHYRQPINWTEQKLLEAHRELRRWSMWYAGRFQSTIVLDNGPKGTIDLLPPSKDLMEALSDDLNTAQAIYHLRQLSQKIETGDLSLIDQHYSDAYFLGLTDPHICQRYARFGQAGGAVSPAVAMFAVNAVDQLRVRLINSLPNQDIIRQINDIGLEVMLDDNGSFGLTERTDLTGTALQKIRSLVEQRTEARKNKDWAKADLIRDELAALGISPKDNADGTATWTLVP